MSKTINNAIQMINRRAPCCPIRVVLSVALLILGFILSKVWGIVPQKFRPRINSAVTVICEKLFPSLVNQEKRSIKAIVVIASTMVTLPVCFCVVPVFGVPIIVVQTVQRKLLHACLIESFIKRAATAIGKTVFCLWLVRTFQERSPRTIHYVAVEMLAIMRSNVKLSRELYYAIWIWSYSRKKSTGSDPDRQPRGLQNLGNTCYFNSVMQSLCNTHVFNNELRNTNRNEKLTLSFHNLADEMKIKGTQAFAPSKVRYDFVKSVTRFDNHGQHDSHECLRHFLDEIRKEQRKTMAGSSGNSLLTAVDKIFGGHLVTVYICKECDKHYHLFEPCLDISLPVFFETETKPVASETHTSSKDEANEYISSSNGQNAEHSEAMKGSKTNSINQDENRHKGSKNNKSDDQDIDYKRSVRKLTTRLNFQTSGCLANYDSTDSTTRMIQINLSSSSKTAISLDDCLKHFSRVEQINEEYLCEDCLREAMARGEADEDNLKLTSATKQTLIFNPPAILTIHFKRFELLPGRSRKRSDMVRYPEYLDIAPYCSSQCLRNDPPRNNIWYSLYAVVVHSGSLESGHYVAYVKVRDGEENSMSLSRFRQHNYFNHNVTSDELIRMMSKEKQGTDEDSKQPKREDDSRWYLMNDSSVYEVDVEEALGQEAYLLFYERVVSTEKQPYCCSDISV